MIILGNVNHDQGAYKAALKNYEKCIKIYRNQHDRDGEARVLTNISNAYSKLGKIDDALDFVINATSVFHEVGDRLNEARALNNTATILDTIGDFEGAVRLYQQALRIHRDVGNRDGEALVLLNIGSIEWHFNERDKAKSILNEALKISDDIESDSARLYCLLNLTDIHLASKEYDKVDAMLERIFAIAEANKPNLEYALQMACECYLKRGQVDKVDQALKRLSTLTKELNVPKTHAIRSQLLGRYYYETKQYDKASWYLNDAIKIFETIRERQAVATSYYYLSKVERAKGNINKADELLSKARNEFSAMKARRWMNIIAEVSK